jgi:serine/threonine-protein kinase RsbT
MPHVVAGVSESIRPGQASALPATRSSTLSNVRVRIPIATESDVALAGEQGRRLASRLDFSPTDITVIATAIIAVARNVLQYARRGEVQLQLAHRRGRLGLAIVARDKGPGIRDLEQALRDGKGLGLATTRRLMDEFRVRSEAGRGTTVTMRKWTRCRQIERAGARRQGHPGMREVR